MSHEVILWIVFGIVVLVMLALDLSVFNRKAHVIELKEALMWIAMWVGLALLFDLGVYFLLGSEMAMKFLAGYLVEESLSVDNLFVFLLIFLYFNVPPADRHRVLYWGILGAVLMRGIFISAGLLIVGKLEWVIYLFGAFLIYTAIRIFRKKEQVEELHPESNPIVRLFCRFMPFTNDYQEDRFFIKREGRWLATPLIIVLVAIETTDIVFAVDSIPAVLSITLEPFIVYTSNIFAILGLRAIFFALAAVIQRWRYLSYGLSVLLAFLGCKMLFSWLFKVPTAISLGAVVGILAVSAIASAWKARRERDRAGKQQKTTPLS
jgi:tellurite resistance protein TerC